MRLWVAISMGIFANQLSPPAHAQIGSTVVIAVAPVEAGNSAKEPESWASAIEQFSADLQTFDRRYRVPLDIAANSVRREALMQWLSKLTADDLTDQRFALLSRAEQTDYLLLRREIEYRLAKQTLDSHRDTAAAEMLPYHQPLIDFLKQREDIVDLQPAAAAKQLDDCASEIERLLPTLTPVIFSAAAPLATAPEQTAPTLASDASSEGTTDQAAAEQATVRRLAAWRACELISDIQRSLKEADRFYAGYNPHYSWWCAKPIERLHTALDQHRVVLRERVVGIPDADEETIVGLPIGAEGLALELRHEWIAHSPDELVALAQREMEWCDQQMATASAELGCGTDWRAALELVKAKHVQPGEQPALIRDLAWEAIRFLEAHDLVTVPPLAASGWTMSMMSPERQRVNPYFLGGDTIIVSFPTDSMTHDEKLMSMRSNNEHFARATVHHELIPGHHLQYYSLARFRPSRALFATPFWMEGWALYWEMQLWDLDFARNAEDRVGMLFWRKHRCARIIFSLSYHLGTMTPEQCIDYLVERVGHERSAATAEVRRSIMGGYSPLYQAAYMLGGLQLRSLHTELVQSGQMSNRQFHDAVLREHSIPIEVLRNYLTNQPLTRDTHPSWHFAK